MAEKHIKKYPNGATLIYYRQNINSTTDVTMGFLSGSRFDGKKTGLAHALEHSIFCGLGDMNERDLYKLFKQTGTIHNAFTNNEVIATTFNTPNKHFEEIFKLDSAMFLKRDFSEVRWQKEKKAILQELYMSLDDEGITSIESDRSKKPKDYILGSPKTLNMIKAKDLADYADKRFVSDNMVISVVSSLPYNEVKKVVEENFIYKFPSDKRKKIDINVQSYPLKNELIEKDKPYANSFNIQFLFKGLDGVEKNDLMLRFEDWYFNDFAGKLYEKLRLDNQLVYSSSFVSVPVLNSNLKAFVVKTSPQNANRCVEVLTEILREAIKNGVSEKDFELFKQSMLEERARKTNIKTYDSDKLFFDYVYGKKPFVRNFFNKLMDLKREDVNEYLKNVYGKSNLSVLYKGDVIKAQNIKVYEKNGLLYPIDKTYPINVVSDEQLVKDYRNVHPLYTLEDIIALYKYWDEIQMEILKLELEEKQKYKLHLNDYSNYKFPKISRKKILKSFINTAMNKNDDKNDSKTEEEMQLKK